MVDIRSMYPVTGHDEPIEAASEDSTPFAHGSNVLSFQELSVKFGRGSRWRKPCDHNTLVYDSHQKRVWCEDCESTVDSFDAFYRLVRYWDDMTRQLDRRESSLAEVEKHKLISRAAKSLDRAFRRKKTTPCCPHCDQAILPEDVIGIDERGGASKELVRAKRRRERDT